MRHIPSPLCGISSPFGALRDPYAILGYNPEFVLDYGGDRYRVDGVATTFAGAVTHSATSNGTMVDIDGLLKWRPHNLALNSATPATQSITVVSGADYTVECTGVSIVLSGAGTGTVTEGNPVEITASTTTLTLTVTGSTGTMWCYRSDLGGMVDNPDTLSSYVPTTSTAVYMARRGNHIWNGSAWENAGVLHESEARTNELLDSGDVFGSNWTGNASGDWGTYEEVTSYFNTTAYRLLMDGVTSSQNRVTSIGATGTFSGNDETASIWVEDGTGEVQIGVYDQTAGSFVYRARLAWSTGTVSSVTGTGSVVFEDLGTGPNGGDLYRVSATCSGTVGNSRMVYIYPGGTSISTNGCIVHGVQLEAGSTPSSYIPTSGAAATRAAETQTVAAANLPWPTPNVIGPELVTNGTFDTDASGWTAANNASISAVSGRLRVTNNVTNYGFAYQGLATVVGNVYRVAITSYGGTASARPRIGTNIGDNNIWQGPTVSGEESSEIFFVAQSTTTYVSLYTQSTGDTDYSEFDNISVVEIDPLSVSIQMEGTMTYADEGGAAQHTLLRWQADASNHVTIDMDTDGAATGEVNFNQADSGTLDTVASASGAYSPGINVPFNIAARHGSTFINGAVDGTALTADTTPVALPDLSSTDMEIGYDFMGNIKTFRVWDVDIGDAGIEEGSS